MRHGGLVMFSRRRKILYRFFLAGVMLFATARPALAQSYEMNDWLNLGADILGWEASVITHEGGHAIFTWLTGGDVLSFDPYPHFVGGALVGGSVTHAGGNHAIIAMMGSLTNIIAFFALTPFHFDIQDPFLSRMYGSMLYFQMIDWFLYVMIDLFKYGGDWLKVEELTGIPLVVLAPLSALSVAVMYQYHEYWRERKATGNDELLFTLRYRFQFW